MQQDEKFNISKENNQPKNNNRNEYETLDLHNVIFSGCIDKQIKLYKNIIKKINRVNCLTKLYIDIGPAEVLRTISKEAPMLKVFDMGKVTGLKLDLTPISKLANLIEFKLEGSDDKGIELKNPQHLRKLKNLKILRLRNVSNMQDVIEYIPLCLTSLDLGPCGSFGSKVIGYRILPFSGDMKSLHLDTCLDPMSAMIVIKSILALPYIAEVNLTNFAVIPILEKGLAKTDNIKKLHIESSFTLDEGEIYLEDDRDFNKHNILRAYYKMDLTKNKNDKKLLKSEVGKEEIHTPKEILKFYSMKKIIKKIFN